MRYQPTLDIWNLTTDQRARLQPGQWVTAGGNKGIYLGTKPSGTEVVAWYGNAKARQYRDYIRTLRNYATA